MYSSSGNSSSDTETNPRVPMACPSFKFACLRWKVWIRRQRLKEKCGKALELRMKHKAAMMKVQEALKRAANEAEAMSDAGTRAANTHSDNT